MLLDCLQKHLGLTWLYDDSVKAQTPEAARISFADDRSNHSGAVVAPPPEVLTPLFQLAKRGQVKGILEQATHLEQTDVRWSNFAAELRRLAKGFQVRQVREFVQQYLDEGQ